MKFESSNWEDVHKYYCGTYVKFTEFGDKLFYIQEVNARFLSGLTEDDDLFKLYLSNEHPYEVSYILPNKAVFQYGDSAKLLQRIPARMWKRGLNGENTVVFDVVNGDVLPLSFQLLKAFVTKQSYFSFHEIAKDKSSKRSYALSRRMAVTRSGTIMCDMTQIGNFDKIKGTIDVHPLFLDNIMALSTEGIGVYDANNS